jgi:3',5'-cyclic AMP phosphodiesterase CpdA
MKKIIHLTDLHIGYKHCTGNLDKIIANIKKKCRPADEYVIVITGDMTDKPLAGDRRASEDDYFEAAKRVRDLKANGFDVLVVPGNHDYGHGISQVKEYVPLFKKVFYGDEKATYPRKNIIGDIAFIGLDSMEGEMRPQGIISSDEKDSIFAAGCIGHEQRAAFADMLASDQDVIHAKKRVLYFHHRPFLFLAVGMLLQDRRELKEILIKNGTIDLLLFGHRHKSKEFHGRWDIPRIYDGGTSTWKDKKSPHRIIDLSKPPSEDEEENFLA